MVFCLLISHRIVSLNCLTQFIHDVTNFYLHISHLRFQLIITVSLARSFSCVVCLVWILAIRYATLFHHLSYIFTSSVCAFWYSRSQPGHAVDLDVDVVGGV